MPKLYKNHTGMILKSESIERNLPLWIKNPGGLLSKGKGIDHDGSIPLPNSPKSA
jgi:hypothetical protein